MSPRLTNRFYHVLWHLFSIGKTFSTFQNISTILKPKTLLRKGGKKPHFRICIFVSKKCQDFFKSETSGPHHFPIRWLLRSISLWSYSGSAVSMQLSCCLVYLGNVSVGHLWSYHKNRSLELYLSPTKITTIIMQKNVKM